MIKLYKMICKMIRSKFIDNFKLKKIWINLNNKLNRHQRLRDKKKVIFLIKALNVTQQIKTRFFHKFRAFLINYLQVAVLQMNLTSFKKTKIVVKRSNLHHLIKIV